jgi:acyl-CoA thioesterase-1
MELLKMNKLLNKVFLVILSLILASSAPAEAQNKDNVHSDSSGQIKLGRRFAEITSNPLHHNLTPPPLKASFIKRLENKEKVTVAMLGTSLTGGKWQWVSPFRDWLNKDYPGQVTIHNLGVGASASMAVPIMKVKNHCGLDRVKEVVRLKPDVVFIEFAMNDAHTRFEISLEQSAKNLNAMIDYIWKANPKTEIIVQNMNSVMNLPGHESGPADTRHQLADYYAMYEQVARDRGVRLINHYPNWNKLMKENPEEFFKYVTDGIHPVEAGYAKYMLPKMKASLLGGDDSSAATEYFFLLGNPICVDGERLKSFLKNIKMGFPALKYSMAVFAKTVNPPMAEASGMKSNPDMADRISVLMVRLIYMENTSVLKSALLFI